MTIVYKCNKCGYEFWEPEASAYRRWKKREFEYRKVEGKNYYEIIYHCPKCDERDNFKSHYIHAFYAELPNDDDYYWWKGDEG